MHISHANQLKIFHKSVVIVSAAVRKNVHTNRMCRWKVRKGHGYSGVIIPGEEEKARREAAASVSFKGEVGMCSALRTCVSLPTLAALKSLFFRTH